MLLEQDNVNETINTIGSDKVGFSVDETALVHIMSVLTNLYAKPIDSVVREITTNAIDSHLISGQNRPVEVLTPTSISMEFVVQDFGTGMSESDLRDLYSRYGASTKRGNDIEAGQLGLGSKSPFAYTDQFTISAVKNGQKTIGILTRNSEGSAELNIVSVTNTDEHNGVKIAIPVKPSDVYDFDVAATHFARYVDKGLVRVNGDDFSVYDELTDLGNNIYVEFGGSEHFIVMGNVAYPIKGRRFLGYGVVYKAKMGEVTFAPSREELIYNDKTNECIERMFFDVENKVLSHVQKEIDLRKTAIEKVRYTHSMRNISGIPRFFNLPGIPMQQFYTVRIPVRAEDKTRTSEQDYASLVIYGRENKKVVKNFTAQKWTKTHTTKLLAQSPHFSNNTIIILQSGDEKNVKSWFGSDVTVINWDDYRAVPVPRKSPAKKVESFVFESMTSTSPSIRHRDIRGYEKILYISKKQYDSTRASNRHLKKNELLVFVPPSKQEAFANKYDAEDLISVYEKRRSHVKACLQGSKIKKYANNSPAFGAHKYTQFFKLHERITSDNFLTAMRYAGKMEKWSRVAQKWNIHIEHDRCSTEDQWHLLPSYIPRNERGTVIEHSIIYINALEEK